MDAIKFMKVDYLKTKSQMKLMLLFIFFGIFLGINNASLGAVGVVVYVVFGALIVSTNPFFMDLSYNRGFYNLLPAKAQSRVYGRYLFGTAYMIASVIIGLVGASVLIIVDKDNVRVNVEQVIVVTACAILFNTFQYLVMSFITVKNPQIVSIIRMIPAFIMFFGYSYLVEELDESGAKKLIEFVEYVSSHMALCSAILLGVSAIFTLISAAISARHELNLEK